VHAKKKI